MLAYAEAAALLAVVLFRVVGLGAAAGVATALAGLVLGPALAVLVGRAMPRLAAASASGQRA